MERSILYRLLLIYILAPYTNKIILCNGNPDENGGTAQPAEESGQSEKQSIEVAEKSTNEESTVSQKNDGVTSSGEQQEKNTESCSLDSQEPSEVNAIPEESKEFQVYTMEESNINKPATIDSSRYTLVPLKYGFKYLFNEGALCTQVKHNYVTVWNHDLDLHGNVYPKKVYYNTHNKRLIIMLERRWFYTYDYVKDHWIYNNYKSRMKGSCFRLEIPELQNTSEYEDSLMYTQQLDSEYKDLSCLETQSIFSEHDTTQSTHSDEERLTVVEEEEIDKDQFKIYTVDDTDPNNVHINEGSKYNFNTLKYGFNYVFKEGTLCIEVRHKDKTVWKHNKQKHGDKYPKSVYYNSFLKSLSIVLASNWFYSYSYINGHWKFNYEKSEGKACEYCLEIPEDEEKIDLFDYSTRYFVTRQGNKFTFSFRDHTDCVQVKVGDNVVWQHDPVMHPDEYPVSVLYNAKTKTLTVWYYRDDSLEEDYSFVLKEGGWQRYSVSSIHYH